MAAVALVAIAVVSPALFRGKLLLDMHRMGSSKIATLEGGIVISAFQRSNLPRGS